MICRVKDNRRELYDSGMSDAKIARSIGRDKFTISHWRTRYGLPAHFITPPSQQRHFPTLYENGQNDSDIARIVGCHRSAVQRWRKRSGFPKIQARRRILPRVRIISLDYAFESGATFHSIIADESWSNWLEENGATVW
ncbi:helix-turn-helix domain-containing protein [Sphingomonas qomolangmaensis]|uniref:Helix-turn-helix domain-containing protein n=1 Tax=Sphingomonas qomolangmaensis TaxID=2918765 RepID=A0ABY5L904_9SPHN|nr:helix-turn-helix domain-containing protein [Sphingomonas qomolangmaensis]UUL83455.1 helix-turn-helix domain-containing protein [Sphingomonas qomolangmaensis]